MLHFNKGDLHEYNISYERFKEIVGSILLKVDRTRYNLESLYNLTSQNLYNNAERTSIFIKKEIITEKENTDIFINRKNETEKFIESLVKYQIILVLEKEIMIRLLKKEKLKTAFLAHQSYLNSKKFEDLVKRQNIDTQIAVAKIMEERRIALEIYKNDLMLKCMLMNEKIFTLKGQAKYLQKEREIVFRQCSEKIAARLNEIKNVSGEEIFKGCTTEQKENFSYEYLKRSHITERKIKNKKNQIKNSILEINKKIDAVDYKIKEDNLTSKNGFNGTFLVGFNNKKRENDAEAEKNRLILELNKANTELQELTIQELHMKKQDVVSAIRASNININQQITETEAESIVNFFECDSACQETQLQAAHISDELDHTVKEMLNVRDESAQLMTDGNQMIGELYSDPELVGFDGLGEVMGLLSSTEKLAENSALSLKELGEEKASIASRLS